MPVHPKKDSLAKHLRDARARVGWTQLQMARYLKVSRVTISTWEANGPPRNGPTRAWVIAQLRMLAEEGEVTR